VRRCVSSANLKNEEAMARTGPLRHKKEKLFLEEPLKIVAVHSLQTSRTTCSATKRHNPEDRNPRSHLC